MPELPLVLPTIKQETYDTKEPAEYGEFKVYPEIGWLGSSF